ncbi:MAG TPA: filamentous hemagglutinin N-terminal domain-containing protein, partial [Limnobacter sp.]
MSTQQFKRKTLALAVGVALSSMAYANPTGMNVVAGQATSQALGDLLKVTNSPGAVIQWQQFNIDANQTTQFIQQNAASQVFNKVVGGDVSQILGSLKSNGQVFLINPAGVIFGQGAVIDTAGFVASALAASTADLVNGHLKFEGDPASNASIQNLGTLTTHSGGSIVLIAPNIQNSGIIRADGEVLLAAGHKVTIVDLNHPTVGLSVEAQVGGQAVNLGDIVGKNASVFASLIKNSGVVEATGVQQGAGGVIRFVAQDNTVLANTSNLNASGVSGGQIDVQSVSGDTLVDGQVRANGQTGVGGQVNLTGHRIAVLSGATVQADGATGGGTVHIGGGWQGKDPSLQNSTQTVVQAGANVSANATDNGQGGELVAWSDGRTQVDASLQARGGANGGNGGRVETSGKELLQVSQAADTRAPKGHGGQWLLDPANLNVVDTLPTSSPPPQTVPPPDPSFQPPGGYFSTGNQTGDSYILASTIKQGLEFGNGSVTLSTRGSAAGNGDINVLAPILVDQPTLYPQPELTLDAAGTININAA